jgi:hypothetical protein
VATCTAAMEPGSMSSPTMVLERRAMVVAQKIGRRAGFCSRPTPHPTIRPDDPEG